MSALGNQSAAAWISSVCRMQLKRSWTWMNPLGHQGAFMKDKWSCSWDPCSIAGVCFFFNSQFIYISYPLSQCLSKCINSSHDGTVGGIIPICLSCRFLFKKLQTQDNEKELLLPARHEGIQQHLMEYSTQQCECTVDVCSSQNPWKTDKHSSTLEEYLLWLGCLSMW